MKVSRLLSPGWWYTGVIAGFLYLPILVLVLFSFNDSQTLVFPLKGFTLRWYGELLDSPELLAALRNSLWVGLLSSLVATALGTAAGLAITRFRFRLRGAFLGVATIPMVIPSCVLGVALLLVFAELGVPLSLWAVGIGHTIINIPYVMLIVTARLVGFSDHIEEAAMDLGASYWETLLRVTLPISAPALLAAFLSSLTTSFDEFAVAFFLVGTDATLPVYLYSQLRFPSRLPLVVTLTSVIMLASVLVVFLTVWLQGLGRQARKALP
jgi:spermidine/putrescine transport system permease protein